MAQQPSVRPLCPADHQAANLLHRSVWWPERSPGGWRWLDENPARVASGGESGWVVEGEDGQAVAFVGNLIQRFWLKDRALFGATGFSLIVPPEQRGRSRDLLKAFIAQPGMFARYTFNANPRSSPLYPRHGMRPWPETSHAMKLTWVTDARACAFSRVLRFAVARAPGLAPRLGERLMNPRLGDRPKLKLPPGVAVLIDFRDRSRFADFWEALKAEGGLIADRSPATLRWRLSDPDQTVPPLVLAFNRGARITGYALLQMGKDSPIAPAFLEIIDLMALQDDAEAIPALMSAIVETAPILGAAKVRLQTVSPQMLDRLGDWGARARREGGWGHCHAAFEADGPDPALWSPTPFDGDYGVCLRPVPIVAAGRTAPSPALSGRASKA